MKTLNKTAVLIAAVDLFLSNSQTTTLDVKNKLRADGYNAKQAEVSQHMKDLKAEEGWTSSDGGGFQIYYPATHGTGATSTATVGSATKVGKGAVVLTKSVSGCWEMNSVTNSAIVFVDGSVTREKARTAYMNQVPGTAWADTRGRKVN